MTLKQPFLKRERRNLTFSRILTSKIIIYLVQQNSDFENFFKARKLANF